MNEREVFLDTGGLVALLNADDWLHAKATQIFERLGSERVRVFTTNLILAELGNCLARTAARENVVAFIRTMTAELTATVVYVDAGLFDEALNFYSDFRDKQWGLVDCASFALMTRENIDAAFSQDHHFEQAGFRCLLPTRR